MEEKLLNEQDLSEVSGGAALNDYYGGGKVCIKDPQNMIVTAEFCRGCSKVTRDFSGGFPEYCCGNGIIGNWIEL